MKAKHLVLAVIFVGAIGVFILYFTRDKNVIQHKPTAAAELPVEGMMPPLDGAIEWLNSPPLTAAGLRGKVVLINFGTYTCINWLRSLPYVRAWAEKYKEHGLVVISVHTPEFPFEHNVENVRRAVHDM